MSADEAESKQRRRIAGLKSAQKRARTLDEKIAAQKKVREAEAELLQLKLTHFERQDAQRETR